ncbi:MULTISPECIES: GntR family transcriptional regulator [Pseudomonas]|uniref:GntR family transcriptional regulator n=1 Tax=Pseudomonas quercus TaxID=2722792 RepID=A0ABX0YKP3_9PSED|nr:MULTISPECIES: GntR family transcriptional regulator [Pseudomonas]MBF7144972.1 GntR family transcriptional regulator [Pseudomonas sp. LY10J]NJP03591.1 GntR family transcriptional regulator [Pseudomonas quercus]
METTPSGRKVSADTLKVLADQACRTQGNQHKIIETTLRTAIIEGKLQPDDRLTQQAVAAAFGLSRMPVREALRGLEMQGYIAAGRYRSYVVTAGREADWAGDLPGLLRAVGEQYARLQTLEDQKGFGEKIIRLMSV